METFVYGVNTVLSIVWSLWVTTQMVVAISVFLNTMQNRMDDVIFTEDKRTLVLGGAKVAGWIAMPMLLIWIPFLVPVGIVQLLGSSLLWGTSIWFSFRANADMVYDPYGQLNKLLASRFLTITAVIGLLIASAWIPGLRVPVLVLLVLGAAWLLYRVSARLRHA
ncbi:hypothetical protein KDA23_00185 [Candidatus Saccharibacteria bacterium]|nr:hypothetical protein [Candidatus Saccharibacteria bacterium]